MIILNRSWIQIFVFYSILCNDDQKRYWLCMTLCRGLKKKMLYKKPLMIYLEMALHFSNKDLKLVLFFMKLIQILVLTFKKVISPTNRREKSRVLTRSMGVLNLFWLLQKTETLKIPEKKRNKEKVWIFET